MKLKRFLVFISAFILLASFTACDSDENKKVDTVNNKAKKSLKIYYMNEWTIQNALGTFKDKYKDVNVEDTIFNNVDEYKNKVTVDTLTGEGPDVLLLSPTTFESVNKFSANGILCDINEFIKKDKDFKISDYNEKVLNSFENDGKRFIIPLEYYINTLVTSRKALEKNNIKIDLSNWSLPKLVETVKKFREGSGGSSKCFFNSRFNISHMIDSSGISFVDYINKKSRYNSDEFVEILESYKEIYPSISSSNNEENISFADSIKNGSFLMMPNSLVSPYFVLNNYESFKKAGEELEIYPFPGLKNNSSSYASFTRSAVGINSQSRNKEIAYDFIKLLMTKDLQRMDQFKNISPGIPVNKAAYKEDAEYFSDSKRDEFLPQKIKIQLDDIVAMADKTQMKETEIDKIIKEALPDFLNGKKTAAQTAKEIDEKVNLYLNE